MKNYKKIALIADGIREGEAQGLKEMEYHHRTRMSLLNLPYGAKVDQSDCHTRYFEFFYTGSDGYTRKGTVTSDMTLGFKLDCNEEDFQAFDVYLRGSVI